MAKSIFATLILALLLCGCGGSSSHPVTLVSVTVTPSVASIAPGTTTQFKAAGNYSNGSVIDLTASVVWSSSNTQVATISNLAGSPGVATAVGTGSDTISATSDAVAGTATLTVASVQSITVGPASPAVSIAGTNQQFSATGILSNGTVQNLTGLVTWSSSDQSVATISPSSGLSSAVSPGTVLIQASLGNVSGSVSLTVAALQSIAATPASLALDAGASGQCAASGTLSNGTTRDVSSLVAWSSANPALVTVNAAGVAAALSPGSTSVTASFLGISSAPLVVTVLAPTSIVVTPPNVSVLAGSTQQFTATGSFADGTAHDVTNLATWGSTLPGVASFNAAGSRGLATAGASANVPTIISATLGVTGSTLLTVKTLASISVTPASPSLAINATLQLTATGNFSDGSTQNLTGSAAWSSNASGVASVSNLSGTKGLVTALSLGSAGVSAAVGSTSGSSTVTVSATGGGAPTNRAYVTNFGSNSLSVLDTLGNTVVATVPVGPGPQGVALNPALNRAYVANNGDGTLSVIDITSNAPVASVPVGAGPWGVAVSPAANRAYVTNKFAGTLSVIDTSTNTVVATVTVGAGPEGVAVNPGTGRVYVANSGGSTVSVIDTGNSVIATVNVGAGPQDIALNPASNLCYVANSFAGTVSVINIATNAVTATVPVGTNPQGVAINTATNRAYVANNGSSNVSVLDTSTSSLLGTVPVGAGPQGITVRAASGKVYVANNSTNTVSVIDAPSNSVIATIQVGTSPKDVAVLP